MRRKIIMCILYLTLIGSLIPLILFALKNKENNIMTTTFTEKEIESIKSTYQSELEKYNSLKKEI